VLTLWIEEREPGPFRDARPLHRWYCELHALRPGHWAPESAERAIDGANRHARKYHPTCQEYQIRRRLHRG
jgi:hypothetical protein